MDATLILARADVSRLLPRFDSDIEAWWERNGALILGNELECGVARTEYHPMTFLLPGGGYTPDFLHILTDGRLVFVETKALILKTKFTEGQDGTVTAKQVHNSRAQKGYRDTRTKLRAAAELHPWALWAEVRVGKRGGEWELEFIQ